MYTQLAEQYTQSIFLRVDVDAQKAVAAKYRVSAMPTFITVKAGAQVDGAQVRGADPHRLVQLIAAHAGPNPPVAPLPAAAEAAEAAGNKAFADGEYEAAAVDYTRALEVAPDTVPLLGNRSFAYLKRYGQTKDAVLRRLAVEDATRATELDPQYQKAWVRLAEAFIAESEDDEGADVQVLLRKAEKALKKGVKTGDRKAKTGEFVHISTFSTLLT
jgi:thioredoxin-like negative regulator of GroEL